MEFLIDPDNMPMSAILIAAYAVIITLILAAVLRRNKQLIFWGGLVTIIGVLFLLFPDAFLSPGRFFGQLR